MGNIPIKKVIEACDEFQTKAEQMRDNMEKKGFDPSVPMTPASEYAWALGYAAGMKDLKGKVQN